MEQAATRARGVGRGRGAGWENHLTIGVENRATIGILDSPATPLDNGRVESGVDVGRNGATRYRKTWNGVLSLKGAIFSVRK